MILGLDFLVLGCEYGENIMFLVLMLECFINLFFDFLFLYCFDGWDVLKGGWNSMDCISFFWVNLVVSFVFFIGLIGMVVVFDFYVGYYYL